MLHIKLSPDHYCSTLVSHHYIHTSTISTVVYLANAVMFTTNIPLVYVDSYDTEVDLSLLRIDVLGEFTKFDLFHLSRITITDHEEEKKS